MPRKPSLSKVRKENADNAAVVAILDDLDQYAAVAAIAVQEGGELLISGLVTDVLGNVETLAGSFRTATHAELIATCASLKANLSLLRVLSRANANTDLANEALADELKK